MTEPNRQSGENEERIIEIEIERLRPFKEHPFQVKDARTGKIGGAHVYFKTCWEDIITAGMADPFCDRLGSKNDSTDLCGCQRNPWVYIHFIDHSDCILLP